MIKRKAFRVCALALVGTGISQAPAMAQCGTASWYHEGAQTANGERYRPDGITAAHRSLPFGTRVLVTHKRTGRTVVVRINDRGPFIGGRIIDLSRGAKRVLGMDGLAPVCITVIGRGQQYASAEKTHRKRVAAKTRRERVASNRHRSVRVVYGTTETSARWDGEFEGRRHHRRVAKRSHNKHVARHNRRERQVREYRREYTASVKLAGWPRSNDPTL